MLITGRFDLNDARSGAQPTGTEALLAAAQFHAVTPMCHLAAKTSDGLEELAERTAGDHRAGVLQHLRTCTDLATVSSALDAADARWAVLKGPYLSEFVYPRPDARSYSDLDVLVDRHRFGNALEALSSAGAILVDRNWPLIDETTRGELTLLLPHGTILDLHWHPIADQPVRRGFRIDPDAMLRDRRLVANESLSIPTLSLVDTVWYLCVHGLLAGGDRLRWLDDIRRVLLAERPDISEVIERASLMGAALPTAIMLERAHRVFEMGESPPNVRHHLRRSIYAQPQRALDRWFGVDRGRRRAMTTRTLASSTRGTDTGSITAFVTQGIWASTFAPLAAGQHPWRRRHHPGPEPTGNPLHRDVRSAAARASFLDTIAR